MKSTSKKVSENNVDFSTIKITSKKVRGRNVDFSTIEITSKKVRGNNVDFSTIEIIQRRFFDRQNYVEKSKCKERGFLDHRNYVDYLLTSKLYRKFRNYVEIISKKYMEMTWKFVEILSSTYQRNIDVKSTSIQRGVLVELVICPY